MEARPIVEPNSAISAHPSLPVACKSIGTNTRPRITLLITRV